VQLALKKVTGVSSVHLDMITRKAVVQTEKGKVTDEQLVGAVSNANGMHQYRATVVQAGPGFSD
jgi:copper chaperone CopZ